jgi:hypothetical protein
MTTQCFKHEWFSPKDKLPNDKQMCLLMPVDPGGLITVGVFGPIAWNEKNQFWIDIFRDPEAGAVVNLDQVGLWCDWDFIAPKEEG